MWGGGAQSADNGTNAWSQASDTATGWSEPDEPGKASWRNPSPNPGKPGKNRDILCNSKYFNIRVVDAQSQIRQRYASLNLNGFQNLSTTISKERKSREMTTDVIITICFVFAEVTKSMEGWGGKGEGSVAASRHPSWDEEDDGGGGGGVWNSTGSQGSSSSFNSGGWGQTHGGKRGNMKVGENVVPGHSQVYVGCLDSLY